MRPYLQHGRRHAPSGSDPIPGLSSSAIAAAAYCWGVSGGSVSVPAGGLVHQTYVPFAHFQTTDSTVFGTDTTTGLSFPHHNTAGDKYLYFAAHGAYLVAASVVWATGGYSHSMIIDNPGGQWMLDAQADYLVPEVMALTQPVASTAQTDTWSHRLFYVDSTAGPGDLRVLLTNFDASTAHSVTGFTLGIFWLGGPGPDLATIY